jgi:hypothetical protein
VRASPYVAVITRPTRLQGLRERWGTQGQAEFVLGRALAQEAEQRQSTTARQARAATAQEADFAEYRREEELYQRTVRKLRRDLDFGMPTKFMDRSFVPSFDFWSCVAVVVVGQDGLVANVAKYVGELPIIGVNPDPERFDGLLLPFEVEQAAGAVGRVLGGEYRVRKVSLAQAVLNDGQRLLAFNDLFLGCASHVSARYTVEVDGQAEPQSSSGILVSTGAGSTGWMSSVFNMAAGVARFSGQMPWEGQQLEWEDRRLLWAVREPFVSRHSRASLVAGLLEEGREIVVESLMPSGGVIFSDGVESDFLPFNAGAIARVGLAATTAQLVVA